MAAASALGLLPRRRRHAGPEPRARPSGRRFEARRSEALLVRHPEGRGRQGSRGPALQAADAAGERHRQAAQLRGMGQDHLQHRRGPVRQRAGRVSGDVLPPRHVLRQVGRHAGGRRTGPRARSSTTSRCSTSRRIQPGPQAAEGHRLRGASACRSRANGKLDWRKNDWAAFLGASYFRAIGELYQYGQSARGIAIDTAVADRVRGVPRLHQVLSSSRLRATAIHTDPLCAARRARR